MSKPIGIFKIYLKDPLVLLSILFFVVSILLFFDRGVKNVNDSYRYLDYAIHLKDGFYFDKHNFWYLGYALFLLVVRLFHESEMAIIIGQILLSWIAVISLYKAYILLFNDKKGGFITALLYIFFIEIMSWNYYILCESMLCSLTCISFYFLARIHSRNANMSIYISAAFFVLLTSITKPTGVAILGATFLVGFYHMNQKIKNKALKYSFFTLCMAGFILLINKMLTTFLIMENYQLGEIIYGITTLPDYPQIDLLIVTPPNDLYFPDESLPPLIKIIGFILHNPLYWFKLFTGKVFYFLLHVRPYWSIKHNIFSLLVLVPVYFYFFKVLRKKVLDRPILIFSVAYFFFQILSIGFTSVDWDGRFLMPLLPLIFMISSSHIIKDILNLRIRAS